jgi:hypothetical protein
MSGWEEYSDEGSYLKPVKHHLARVGRDDPHALARLWHLDCKRWSRCQAILEFQLIVKFLLNGEKKIETLPH